MNTNNLKTRIKSLKNDNKKVWMAPELEILEGRKTYSGSEGSYKEDSWECDQSFGENCAS
jgi:hypothetical protein